MDNKKRYEWYKVAGEESDLIFPANGLLQLRLGEKEVCLAKVNDDLYACASKCPHAGGAIAAGYIDAMNNIVCPLHRYKFNLQNGRNVSGEGYYLKIYPVDRREDGVYVGIESSNFFSWL